MLHYLFRDCRSLSSFYSYIEQCFLALYLQEATQLWGRTLQLLFLQSQASDQLTIDFFTPMSPARGMRQPLYTLAPNHTRSMRPCNGLTRQWLSSSNSSQRQPRTLGCPQNISFGAGLLLAKERLLVPFLAFSFVFFFSFLFVVLFLGHHLVFLLCVVFLVVIFRSLRPLLSFVGH